MTSIPLFAKYSLHSYNDNSSCINGLVDAGDFGPVSKHCGDAFDLTLLFEQSFLSIAPSAIFLVVFIFRSWYLLRHRTRKARRSTIWALKLIINVVLGAIQLALVVLWSQHTSQVSLAAATLALVDSLALCFLSNFEHIGTIRTSTVINVYLFFSTIFDAVQCRTLWLLQRKGSLPILFSVMIAIKSILLFLEAQGKDSLLLSDFKDLGPEATSGVFSKISFWWLNPLLARGFRFKMKLEDLFTMGPEFSGERLGSRMEQVWNQWSMHKAIGYGLIGSTALIYLGLAFCTGAYRHHTYRAITMVRGSMVVVIFRKTLGLDSSNSADNSASVTLMSTDIDGIASSFDAVHDIWACPIEIALGLWLLERHVGVACIAPALTALGFLCFLASLYLARFMGRGRREWNQAVQKRVTHTSAFLHLIKEVRMLGLREAVSNRIQQLRVTELDLSKRFRVMTAWSSFLSHATPVLSPILTFGLYAVVQGTGIGKGLDVGAAFSSLSLISLLTEPASNLFHAIPTFASGLGCFERIQEFLLTQGIDCTEPFILSPIEIAAVPDQTSDTSRVALSITGKDTEKDYHRILLDLQNASFGVKEDGKAIVSNINMQIQQSSLTVITGRVGCGKSTLLKGMLGEIPCSQGSIRRDFQDVAYCDQSPWLRNITIRQNIIGDSNSSFNEQLYDSIIEACALKPDFSQFPEGDRTIIGSNGVTLSGGQKQRITLARALYNVKRLMILDNIFSGLDSTTADQIFDKVFSSGGLKDILDITAVIVSHNAVWLEWWVQDSHTWSGNNGFYFGIYIMFGVSSLILVILTVRFSQDMTLVDMALPPATFLTVIGVLNCIGGAVMVIIGAKYLAIMVPLALIMLYCLQKFYLRTSRQLRFLDLEAKSPLYSHFLETLNGLTTIRAFGWVSTFKETNIALLAESQRPYYLLYCIQRWLNLVLDIFVGALAVLLLTFAVTLSDITSPGALGVAMINLLNFNQDLANLIDSWTRMETSLGAIARLRDLENDTPQPAYHSYSKQWSFRRAIEFRQVSASYGPEKPLVLANLSLRIEHGRTVAICGRTGSGETQGVQCDDIMISALVAVGLWDHIQEKGGLDIDESDFTLSAGQQQLFSFARALVQKNLVETRYGANVHGGIVVLDEANSNVDMETSFRLQRLLKKEFASCGWTTLVVTHRHETMDFADEVIVLDAGRVVNSARLD
ncbi:P-loop containing nucleoside triphosphate hydrolase protein [Aspergillus parasiticus]|uniref:P-loop containing nucleoside triphosphate hydrolase protein n=1 Tax=Aspergillus parasiticus TaxID=5067 RepID=A0A5N6D2F6_ASPPA|nr:P-loop containing nucleoside triphosphate hydrolase protein [Aspergillus parasiticus]